MTYEGVCIGGPCSGQFRSSHRNWLECEEQPGLAGIERQDGRYRHMSIEGVTVWCHASIPTKAALLHRLIAGYGNSHGKA